MPAIRTLLERVRGRSRPSRTSDHTVAIACQGGGSHAAFTGGVLDTLFEKLPEDHRIVGLSGASGGAVSAAAAWYGHLEAETTAGDVLTGLWDDVAASAGWEAWVNELTVLKTEVPNAGGLSSNSPYANPGSDWGRQYLEATLTGNVEFGRFEELASRPDAPALFVSAANVQTGEPTLFRAPEISADEVIASAAVPELYEAVEIDGDYYWDGFLAQNPPICEFLTEDGLPPIDELWVIRLTPQTVDEVPRTTDAIYDRTQELVENLALTQELGFVEKVNDWVGSGALDLPGQTHTNVETIELDEGKAETSRINRRSSFIGDLYADGQAAAEEFLAER